MAGEDLTSHILRARHTLEFWSARHAFMDDFVFSFEVLQVLTRPIDQIKPVPKNRNRQLIEIPVITK